MSFEYFVNYYYYGVEQQGATLAQLVERIFRKDEVPSSSLGGGSMNIFEKVLYGKETDGEIENLHKDFRITRDGFWYFNREAGLSEGSGVAMKGRFGFTDPTLLNGCELLTKIGKNEDKEIETEYVGFSYANNLQEPILREWLEKFPYAEIIKELDENGVSKPSSSVEIIKGDEQED